MARGTIGSVNKALIRPLMMAGVEKRLALLNALLSFPLIAATHFRIPACFIGIGFFIALHFLLVLVSKSDPHLGKLFKRSTRYSWRSCFPAKSHPSMTSVFKIKTVSRPW